MSTITTGMASQYADSTKLAARARIHHFADADGGIDVTKQAGLLISRKSEA